MIIRVLKGTHSFCYNSSNPTGVCKDGPTQRQLSVNRFVQYGPKLKIHASFMNHTVPWPFT